MKTWIIVISILFAVFKVAEKMLANYIRNDKEERVKYYFTEGATIAGIIYALCWIISVLLLCTDCILLLIYFL